MNMAGGKYTSKIHPQAPMYYLITLTKKTALQVFVIQYSKDKNDPFLAPYIHILNGKNRPSDTSNKASDVSSFTWSSLSTHHCTLHAGSYVICPVPYETLGETKGVVSPFKDPSAPQPTKEDAKHFS